MIEWKNVGEKLLRPPGWLIIIMTLFSTCSLAAVFKTGMEETVIAYIIYVFSFYTVSIICVFFVKFFPDRYKAARKKIYDIPLTNRYMTDTIFKVKISLYISLFINLGYSVFKLISGFIHSSLWLDAVAVYYILLSVIRFLLLRFMKKNNNARHDLILEYRRYRLSAVLMMLINVTLLGMVVNMLLQNKSAFYSDIYVITSAVYTFYAVTVSIADIIKYRNYQSPVIAAAKAIRFSAALVSLLSLETSMLIQFGDDERFRRVMTAITGAGVFIIILSMSLHMIIRSNREIHRLITDRKSEE